MMTIPLTCAKCMQDDVSSAGIVLLAEIRDEGPYQVECSHGHRSFVLLQAQRFQILFQIGAYAIVDGYYREAVSCFTASLERFYEFFVRAAMIEDGMSADKIEKAWKIVSRQSERQLGAFVFMYLREVDEVPPILSQDDVKFRNDVIHSGTIPTRDEAIAYGERVLTQLRSLIDTVVACFPNGVGRLTLEHLMALQRATTGPAATVGIGTIVSLGTATEGLPSLAQALASLPKWLA